MTGAKAEPFRRVFYYRPDKAVRDLLRELGVPVSEEWNLSVSPSPQMEEKPICASLGDMTLEKLGVVFGSVVSVRRNTAAGCDNALGAAR